MTISTVAAVAAIRKVSIQYACSDDEDEDACVIIQLTCIWALLLDKTEHNKTDGAMGGEDISWD